MKTSLLELAAMVAVGALSGVALANHTEPSQAKKARFALVNGFEPCSSPNTMTQEANAAAACAPPVPGGFGPCAFSSGGSESLTLALTGSLVHGNQDVKVAASAKGLVNCDGERLCVSLSYRVTADDCPEGSCTTIDADNLKLRDPACCLVANGTCKIKASLLQTGLDLFSNGKDMGIEVRGCGLAPQAPLAAGPAVACGILLK